jgi:copper chaperone NosL
MKSFPFILLTFLMLTACKPEPRPIAFGQDACHFCKMTVVDRQHGSEAVTDKGRIYTFDAIECMVHYVGKLEDGEKNFAHLLDNDYEKPAALIPAQESYYLISRNIPSPMGEFLTAFSTQSAAEAMKKAKGGKVYDWAGIMAHLNE